MDEMGAKSPYEPMFTPDTTTRAHLALQAIEGINMELKLEAAKRMLP